MSLRDKAIRLRDEAERLSRATLQLHPTIGEDWQLVNDLSVLGVDLAEEVERQRDKIQLLANRVACLEGHVEGRLW